MDIKGTQNAKRILQKKKKKKSWKNAPQLQNLLQNWTAIKTLLY